jgi:hypothetical protein
MTLKRCFTQNFMLIPNMSVSARSFVGRKHALMAPVLFEKFHSKETKQYRSVQSRRYCVNKRSAKEKISTGNYQDAF